LSVEASGAGPLTYQWHKGDVQPWNGVAAVLVIPSASRADNGSYYVEVSNPGGSVVSSNAILQILAPQKLFAPTMDSAQGFSLLSKDADSALPLAESYLGGFKVEASTNLLDWTLSSCQLSLTNGLLRVVDTDATNFPLRFYRILEQTSDMTE
jgi:hypothetical protein